LLFRRPAGPGGDGGRGVIFCCFEDQDVAEAARLMQEKQVHQLPVLNRDKRLVGIVSLGDLAGSGKEG
jgi:CBS domain-containing protein